MAYNTRRTNSGYPPNQSGNPPMGQRRPTVTNNFIPGGQLINNQQQKPIISQPQRAPPQQQQQQQQPAINFRNQAPPTHSQSNYASQFSAQVKPEPITPNKPPVAQQPPKPPVAQQQQQQPPKPPAINFTAPSETNPPPTSEKPPTSEDGDSKKKWTGWKTKGNKISNSERMRRRNMRLSKILQPKNAIMILNELARGCTYLVEELPVKVDSNQYRATVAFDGMEFAGTGRTKRSAKNVAAETALRHIIKNKQFTTIKKTDDKEEEEEMEVDTTEEATNILPWSHIASFAMYKLFSAWGEDLNMVNKVSIDDILSGQEAKKDTPTDPKPARKLPDNPDKMNPMMLMNQMLPNSIWEEVSRTGNPPNMTFTFRVTVNEKNFTGTGSSKKAAKKVAAYAACHDLLNITYPPDVWSPVC